MLADGWAAATLGDFLGAGRAAIEGLAWKPLKHTSLHPFSTNGIDFRRDAMTTGLHLLMSCKLDRRALEYMASMLQHVTYNFSQREPYKW